MNKASAIEHVHCKLIGKCELSTLLPVGVCMCTIVGDQVEVEYVNDNFCELANSSRESLVENFQVFLNEFSETDVIRFYELYKESTRTEKVFKWEGRKHSNGDLTWLRLEANVFFVNNAVKFIGILQDITEQKNIELILKENEIRFQGIFSNISNVAIQGYLLDGTVTYWNKAAESFYGYSANEAIGHNLVELLIPEDFRGIVRKELKQMEKTKEPIPSGELVMKHKDGSPVPVYSAHTIVDIPGVGAELFCIDTDLSKIKRIEQASRAKTEFLANMSHEIRTPLNAIVGLTHLMRKSGATQKQIERLDQIDSSSRHLLSIINDILDLSKIEAGQMPLYYNEFNLSSLIDTVTSLIGSLAKEKGLTVKVDLQDVPMFLNGDAIRLRQALLNFAGNAVKFTNVGTITIRTKLIEETEKDVYVRFEVEDTGVGIKQDDIDRLFQPFEQVVQSTTKKNNGTGLGLAITRRLAMLMEGEAGVDSTVGVGSVFWFTAKLQRGTGEKIEVENETSDEIEKKLRDQCHGSYILLAEDNEVNQLVACELLKEVGLKVDVAENGEEAVRMYSEKQYDLVLMDVQMPIMDGFTATRTIIENNPTNIVPIVAMTANVFDEGREESKACGMVDFVPKPVDPVQFYNVLHVWLPEKENANRHDTLSESDTTAYDNFLSILDEVPGLDTDVGMSVSSGKSTVYKSILKLFLESHKNDIQDVDELVKEYDYDNAEKIVHALKGTSGNIGAMKIHYHATELDIALKCSDETLIKEQLDKLLSIFPGFILMLSRKLDEIDKIAVTEADNKSGNDDISVDDIVLHLYNLLKGGDSKAISYFSDNCNAIKRLLGEMQVDILEKYINNFDFAQAIKVLKTHIRSLT